MSYAYTVKQDVDWTSAGEPLAMHSEMRFYFLLRAAAAPTPAPPDGHAVVEATYVRVQAIHKHKDSIRLVDSHPAGGEEPIGADEPLLGNLLALPGVTLQLTINTATGAVTTVTGGERIVANINKRVPATDPSETPPLDAAARRIYLGAAPAAWWTTVLALPGTTAVALNHPLQGSLERTWKGDRFDLALPAGVTSVPGQLFIDPTPVRVDLANVKGAGAVRLANGWPAESTGDLSFTLAGPALTQKVEQRHRLTWQLVAQAPPPSPKGSPAPSK